MESTLAISEKQELDSIESYLTVNFKTFVQSGNGFATIRDKKLYRDTDATFEEYCKRKWGLARAQVYRLIESAKVVQNLSEGPPAIEPIDGGNVKMGLECLPLGDKVESGPLPTNERQARELAKVPAENQKEVWSEAVRTAPKDKTGKPKTTAAHVKRTAKKTAEVEKVAEAIRPESLPTKSRALAVQQIGRSTRPPEVPTDENGTALVDREGMVEAFARREDFDALLNQFTQLTKAFSQLGPSATRYLRVQQFQIDLKNARASLSMSRPFAVCPYCQGQGRHDGIDCNGCQKQCGWVTKSTYDQAPSEVRV